MKKYLLPIIVGILTATSGFAQNYTVTIQADPGGFGFANSIANQLNNGSNTLAEVLPSVPDGTTIYTYSPSEGFSEPIEFMVGYGWYDFNFPGGTGGPISGPTLVPGEGAFLVLQGNPTSFNLTFTGTTNAPVLPLSLSCGLSYFVNRQTEGQGTFDNITGQAPTDGAQLFIPSPGLPIGEAPDMESPNYTVYTFCGGAWLPAPPVVPVGTSVFVRVPCVGNTDASSDPCLTVSQSDIVITSSSPATPDFFPSITANCAGFDGVSVFCRPAIGSVFMPGTTPVHCVVLDTLGNAASCDFTVTIAPPPIQPPTYFYDVTAHPGLNLIADQLISGGNTLDEILPDMPDGTVVSKYINSTSNWLESTFSTALGAWVPGNITLKPGDGAFLFNPTPNDIDLFFEGNPNTPVLPIALTNDIILISRQTNDVGNYQNITGVNPIAGATTVYKWNGSGYDQFNFGRSSWLPSVPTNNIGEAWWISPSGESSPPAVPALPRILRQPVSVVVSPSPAGPTFANFAVTATGATPLQYQWRLNANPIPGAINSDFSITNVQPTNCGNYDVLVQNPVGIAQSVVATLSLAGATSLPFADAFANAGAIPSTLTGSGTGSNVNATVEPNEPSPGFIPGGASVWVTWIAPATGVATFSTSGSSFDTLLAIYTGTSLTGLVPVASDDDSGGFLCSLTSFNVVQGTQYDIQVDGFYGLQGSIVLNWNVQPTANQLPVIVTQPHNQTVGFGGSAQLTASVTAGSSVRYQWFRNGVRIPGAISDTLNFANINLPEVGVYQLQIINNIGGLSTFSLPAEIQINTPAPGQPVNTAARAESKLEAVMDTTVRPNDPYDPPIVTGYSGVEVFSAYNSVEEAAEPLHCGLTCYFTKWHAYTAPANGLLIVANSGTTFQGVLGVYTGPDFSLVPLACSAGHGAGNEVVSFETFSNTTYWISMSGTNANNSGTVELSYATYVAPEYTLLPMSQSDTAGSNVVLSVVTSGNPAATYQWQVNGTNIAGATNASLTLDDFSNGNEGNYTVYAMNIAGTNFFELAPVFLNNPPRFVNFFSSPGIMSAQFVGIANSNYLFQSSTDNVNWVTTGSMNSLSGIMNFSAPVDTNTPSLFYRGVLPAPIQ